MMEFYSKCNRKLQSISRGVVRSDLHFKRSLWQPWGNRLQGKTWGRQSLERPVQTAQAEAESHGEDLGYRAKVGDMMDL